jgi:hypothetical protein
MSNLHIKIIDSNKVIQQRINNASSQVINNKLKSKIGYITSESKKLAVSFLMSSPEIASLSGGELAGAFGLTSGADSAAVSSISQAFMNSIYAEFKHFDKNLKNGGVYIYFQPSSFSNLLSLPAGHTIYEKGDLHWLQWLLERGDEVIVAGYSYDAQSGLGRSGLGYMSEGGAFRVPPQFSGTSDNNFITRALIGEAQEKQISKILQDVLK